MKIQLLIENLEKNISAINKIIPTTTQVPILSNVLLEAKKEGLFITATDLDIGIRVKIPAKVIREGKTTIPGKQLIEVVASLPKDKIEIEQNKDTLEIKSRGNSISFQTISAEEFPEMYKEKGKRVGEFNNEEVRRIFEPLMFSVSTESARPQLTGVYVGEDDGKTVFVSTDGYRLSLRTVDGMMLRLEEGVVLSARIINELLSLKNTDQTIGVYINGEGSQVLFESEEVLLVGRLIEGTFPNYKKVIPTDCKTEITVDREEFLQNARLSTVFAKDTGSTVLIEIKERGMRLITKSGGVGKAELEIEGEKKGENGSISFNPRFLTDVLKNMGTKTITMKINSPQEPALFTGEDKSFIHVIMPVQTTD